MENEQIKNMINYYMRKLADWKYRMQDKNHTRALISELREYIKDNEVALSALERYSRSNFSKAAYEELAKYIRR